MASSTRSTTTMSVVHPMVDDAVKSALSPVKAFAKDSTRFVNRCQKPNLREFKAIACRTAVGFTVMGFVGFFVKLIFIPINTYITGASI